MAGGGLDGTFYPGTRLVGNSARSRLMKWPLTSEDLHQPDVEFLDTLMWIGWGPEMTFLYNDAYISVLSMAKHPKCLGHPARKVWAEIWDICGPLADKVFEKGEATFVDDVRLFSHEPRRISGRDLLFVFLLARFMTTREKWSASFPCPSTETTPKILNVRRLGTLSELAAKALLERTTEAACASSLCDARQQSRRYSLRAFISARWRTPIRAAGAKHWRVQGHSPRQSCTD